MEMTMHGTIWNLIQAAVYHYSMKLSHHPCVKYPNMICTSIHHPLITNQLYMLIKRYLLVSTHLAFEDLSFCDSIAIARYNCNS